MRLDEQWVDVYATAAHLTITVTGRPDIQEGDVLPFSVSAGGFSATRQMRVHAIRPAGAPNQFDIELEDARADLRLLEVEA